MEAWVAPLADYFTGQLGQPVRGLEVRRLAEGHSRQMVLAHVEVDGALHRYVVRVEQGGIFGTSSAEEYRVMGALFEAGFPVARVRWYEPTGRVLGEPFFVMDYVDGDPDPPDLDTLRAFVTTLEELHQLDWKAAGLEFDLKPTSVEEATHQQIARWEATYRAGSALPIPLLDEAGAWLRHHAAGAGSLRVVHGDPGPGNFVHADGQIRALTDFEFCHLGDPAEDWVFCATMRGPRALDGEGWRALYREVGVELDPERWRYWEAFNLFKGACANTTALRVFCAGGNPAPNLAIVGTGLQQAFLRQLTGLISS